MQPFLWLSMSQKNLMNDSDLSEGHDCCANPATGAPVAQGGLRRQNGFTDAVCEVAAVRLARQATELLGNCKAGALLQADHCTRGAIMGPLWLTACSQSMKTSTGLRHEEVEEALLCKL